MTGRDTDHSSRHSLLVPRNARLVANYLGGGICEKQEIEGPKLNCTDG